MRTPIAFRFYESSLQNPVNMVKSSYKLTPKWISKLSIETFREWYGKNWNWYLLKEDIRSKWEDISSQNQTIKTTTSNETYYFLFQIRVYYCRTLTLFILNILVIGNRIFTWNYMQYYISHIFNQLFLSNWESRIWIHVMSPKLIWYLPMQDFHENKIVLHQFFYFL